MRHSLAKLSRSHAATLRKWHMKFPSNITATDALAVIGDCANLTEISLDVSHHDQQQPTGLFAFCANIMQPTRFPHLQSVSRPGLFHTFST